MLLVAVGALAQPPKSSSAVTVGVGFVEDCEAPHPAPTSFGVNLSGTFIMEGVWGGGEVVSLELQAFPPQGSIELAERIFIVLADVVTGGDFAAGC